MTPIQSSEPSFLGSVAGSRVPRPDQTALPPHFRLLALTYPYLVHRLRLFPLVLWSFCSAFAPAHPPRGLAERGEWLVEPVLYGLPFKTLPFIINQPSMAISLLAAAASQASSLGISTHPSIPSIILVMMKIPLPLPQATTAYPTVLVQHYCCSPHHLPYSPLDQLFRQNPLHLHLTTASIPPAAPGFHSSNS